MPLTDKLSVVSQALVDKIRTNQAGLGINAVYYGDQDKIPTTPIACVEPDAKTNTLKSAQRMILIDFTAYILLYHSSVVSPQVNRSESDELAEAVETLIHADRTLGELLIHCMITNVASGYANKAGSLVRASRLTFNGQSQALLPS